MASHLNRSASTALMAAFLLGLLPNSLGAGQLPRSPSLQLPGATPPGNLDDPPPDNPVEQERLLNALNADRQKSMVSDTNRLFRLVNDLNTEISRTSPGTLSPNQLRKLAEIEKLAHNVRDKMSYSVRGTAPYRLPTLPRR